MFETVLESSWQGKFKYLFSFFEKRYLKSFLEKCKKGVWQFIRYPSKNSAKIVSIPILSNLDFKKVPFRVIPGTKIVSFQHEWN